MAEAEGTLKTPTSDSMLCCWQEGWGSQWQALTALESHPGGRVDLGDNVSLGLHLPGGEESSDQCVCLLGRGQHPCATPRKRAQHGSRPILCTMPGMLATPCRAVFPPTRCWHGSDRGIAGTQN